MVNIVTKLAQEPTLELLETIPNPQDFSSKCSPIFNQTSIDTKINWSPTWGYDLEPIPKQFHPTANKAIDIHMAQFPRLTRAWIHLNQGILEPEETFRISRVHFDAWLDGYPEVDYPNNDVLIVSDALPTQFTRQKFDVADLLGHESDDLNTLIIERLESQIDERAFVTPATYQLTRCDSFTVHKAQIPKVETARTFMMMRFY